MKFITFSVAAEVIVIFEHENARFGAEAFAEKIRSREAADAGAHDNQIVVLAGSCGFACSVPEGAVAKAVRDFERAGMAAAKAGGVRRIVAGRVLFFAR